jgi:hypothetical protein
MKAGNVLDVKPLLTQRDLARLLGLAESTMETWRLVGKGGRSSSGWPRTGTSATRLRKSGAGFSLKSERTHEPACLSPV